MTDSMPTPEPPALVEGQDGLKRCAWANPAQPDYVAYHDTEWGQPVHGEQRLFERLTLEAFQSGLSWLTILRKRDNFRAAFAYFDADVVARFGEAEVEQLMGNAGIVRNQRKIRATITNARAVQDLRQHAGLDATFWGAKPAEHTRPKNGAQALASTPESAALAKTLKKAGFAHLGPVTLYAAMQACGVVDDHFAGCFRALGSELTS
ncbi:DNA-3-methyladenine glycosylase I [Ornithinimicrobium sp. Arc0846-15]|nr:DNA-3-methyladenine glycosylase I [Ornithinimicrobium laminariae]